MGTIQIIELFGVIPLLGSIIGIWVKMNNLISKQEIKIENLQKELVEFKRQNEKQEEKIEKKLDVIDEKLDSFMMHFSKCLNFKTTNNG